MSEAWVLLPQTRGNNRDFNAHVRAVYVIGGEIGQRARFEVAEKGS